MTEYRSVLVILADGSKRRVSDIPKDAKITFGPIQPGKGVYGAENALRIYTSASNQLAVFVGVKEFRDESLKVETQAVKKQTRSRKGGNESYFEASESSEWE